MPIRIRYKDIPSSTQLFNDFLYDFERVRPYYGRSPSLSEFESVARKTTIEPEHRKALVKSLRYQNEGCGEEVAKSLSLLEDENTVAITTGQQIGLLGGPSFSVYKALTAVKVASTLRSRGVQAVPIFWLATEDHDLAEVDHAWLLDVNNRPSCITVETLATVHQPVGEVQLAKSEPARLREAVTTALGDLPHAELAAHLASESYSVGADLRSAFKIFFRSLFDRYGLILVDPMDSTLRRLAAPTVRTAIENAMDLNQEIVARGASLEQDGYHAQCHVTASTSPVFLMRDHRRATLTIDGEYVDGEQRYGVRDLCALLDESPERFSPNVLLRPIVQDFLLPTAVYIAGPAELAYLAQAEVLYRRLLGRMPVIAPRASFTVLDARAERYLKRYELDVTDCFQRAEDLRRKIAGKLIPTSLEKAFHDGENSINMALDAIDSDLAQFDPTLGAALLNIRKKMFYQFGKVRSSVARESLRRNERAEHETEHLTNLIFPNGTLQERSFSGLSFLARYGEHFLDHIYESIQVERHDHEVIVL